MSMTFEHNGLFATATVISLLGLLGPPAPAHADPLLVPPNCNGHFLFSTTDIDITQDDGTDVFPATDQGGTNISGPAYYLAGPARKKTTGSVVGGMDGTFIDFTANWDTGGSNHYQGNINPDTSMSGTTRSNTGATEGWRSGRGSLKCAQPAAAPGGPAPVQPGPVAPVPPPAASATVANDVDLYNVKNVPDGAGHVLGFLPAGSTVTLVGTCNKEDWCQVSGATLDQRNGTTQNNAQGWVWGNLNF